MMIKSGDSTVHSDRLGLAARGYLEGAPPEDVLGAQGHAERAVPEQLIALVGGDAEAPRAAARRVAQAALDGAAAALQPVPAGSQDGGDGHEEDKEAGEEPRCVER